MTTPQLNKLIKMSWKEFGLKFTKMLISGEITKEQYTHLMELKEEHTPYITDQLPPEIYTGYNPDKFIEGKEK